MLPRSPRIQHPGKFSSLSFYHPPRPNAKIASISLAEKPLCNRVITIPAIIVITNPAGICARRELFSVDANLYTGCTRLQLFRYLGKINK